MIAGDAYLLDTSCCIDVMKNHPQVLARLRQLAPGDCCISTVTSFELFTGVEKCANPASERVKVQTFVGAVSELSFDADAARESSRIRVDLESRGATIGPYDLLIAGQARAGGLILVTSNTGEFGCVAGLSIENWQIAGPGTNAANP